MKVTFWVATDRIGSKCERTIEIPDEELEGLTPDEQEDLIEEYGKEEIWWMAEWGWNPT